MASNSQNNLEIVYKRVLRRRRRSLHLEMPDTGVLLEDPRLKPQFTVHERREITGQLSSPECAEKLVQLLEFKGPDMYNKFLSVLVDYRPSLVDKLRTSEREEMKRMSSQEEEKVKARVMCLNQGNEEFDEEAGIFGLSACNPGPTDHIRHISHSGRQFLADQLNKPQDTFIDFCHAMRIDYDLIQQAQRSGNPTAWLLQEIQNKPDATLNKLAQALESIGKSHLYDSLLHNYCSHY